MKLKLPNIYSFFSKTATLNKDNEITEYQFEHYKAENLCNLRQPGPVSPSVYDHQPKSSATEIIARLQAKLRDETEAKQVVIQNYKKLYQKYLNVLITLARVIEVLRSKSKKKMTPLKLNLIYYLFEKRINNSDASVEEKAHRTNQANINKLVNWAKHNLVRKSSVSKNM